MLAEDDAQEVGNRGNSSFMQEERMLTKNNRHIVFEMKLIHEADEICLSRGMNEMDQVYIEAKMRPRSYEMTINTKSTNSIIRVKHVRRVKKCVRDVLISGSFEYTKHTRSLSPIRHTKSVVGMKIQ